MEFTTEQQQAIWEGWRDGESFRQDGDRVGQPAHVVQYFLRSQIDDHTVRYLSPRRVCRYACSSTPIAVTPSNR